MQLPRVKRIVRPFVPVAIIEGGVRRHEEFKRQREIDREAARRRRLEGLHDAVGNAMAAIASMSEAQCVDTDYLEHTLIIWSIR